MAAVGQTPLQVRAAELMKDYARLEYDERCAKRLPDVTVRFLTNNRPSGDVAMLAAGTTDTRTSTSPAGDAALELLYDMLRKIDAASYPRSHHQRKFHESFVKASLRSIYGDEYPAAEEKLLKRFESAKINPIVMIVTPRRFGKTYSVAQYVAAYSAAIDGREVAIFSTGRRASKKMLDLVMKFLMPLIAGRKKIFTQNVEEVVIQMLEPPYAKNKICSYPAKVQARTISVWRISSFCCFCVFCFFLFCCIYCYVLRSSVPNNAQTSMYQTLSLL